MQVYYSKIDSFKKLYKALKNLSLINQKNQLCFLFCKLAH